MKKLVSLFLSLILIFSCLTVTGFAYDEDEITNREEKIIITEDTAEDEELQKITALMTQAATYIYNYATKPEEPAVDLDTVIKIVTIIVKIVYSLYKQQAETQI